MARKKKRLQKKQFISMFENGNYKKVISKAKQYEIDGLSEDELHGFLTSSYLKLAEENFENGDMARAIRDIDSLLKIDNSDKFGLIKLKYLCYIEHFEEAVVLGEELSTAKDPKIKREAIFLRIMANLYSGNYSIDKKLLKAIPPLRERYLLGFRELLQDDKSSALEHFEQCNPRSKAEKENLRVLISIIKSKEVVPDADIKPLYRFMTGGDGKGMPNTKNSRTLQKELKGQFEEKQKNSALKGLLELRHSVDTHIIIRNFNDKDLRLRLIYNNIVLLAKEKKHSRALQEFVKHKSGLVHFVESAILFMNIKNIAEDRKNDTAALSFVTEYLKLHHKKLAPFQMDHILLFLIEEGKVAEAVSLAEYYGRDSFVLLIKDMVQFDKIDDSYQARFDNVFKRFSIANEALIKFIVSGVEAIDRDYHQCTREQKEHFLDRISIVIKLLENLQSPHKKYKNSIFGFLRVLALAVQSYPYKKNSSAYTMLSDVIELHINYFDMERVRLSVDIKALFVSISRQESIKTEEYEEEDYFTLTKKMLLGIDIDSEKYDFDVREYDMLLILNESIKALGSGAKDPFLSLRQLRGNHAGYAGILTLVLDLLSHAVAANRTDTDNLIEKMMANIGITLYDPHIRDSILITIKSYAERDPKVSILFFEYALLSVPKSKRESAWYLKWIDAYVNMVSDYDLARSPLFKRVLNYFFDIQKQKKFKSLNTMYERNLNRFRKNSSLGGLFD